MNIKDVKPTFKFIGELKEVRELLKKDGGTPYGKEIVLYDKNLESEVPLRIFNGKDARYWDTTQSKVITISNSNNLKEVMDKVKSNGTGVPMGVTLVGSKTTEIYTNDDLIASVSSIKKGTTLCIEGAVSYREYRQKVQRDYSIRKLTIVPSNKKEPSGFTITTPVVIKNIDIDSFKVKDYSHKVPILIRTKLENGGYGYRESEIELDKNKIFFGQAQSLSNDQINNVLENAFLEANKNSEYSVMSIIARVKTGAIKRKPNETDLNPMELSLLKMKGADALLERLNSMEEISKFSDTLVFDIIDFSTGKFTESINSEELNLPNTLYSRNSMLSNPMLLDIDKMTKKNDEPSLESLVKEVEVEVKVEEKKEPEKVDDEFPF